MGKKTYSKPVVVEIQLIEDDDAPIPVVDSEEEVEPIPVVDSEEEVDPIPVI